MKYGIALIVFLVMSKIVISQSSPTKTGEFTGRIFFDAYTEVGNGDNQTAMEIQRIYFGYNHRFNENLSGIFLLDIGSPENESAYALIRRYAYFRNGGLRYKRKSLIFNIGLIDGLMFKSQEKYWAHRYIERSFMDRYRFAPSADIGFNIQQQWKKLTFDMGIYNGEGYKNLQFDNSYRLNLGISYQWSPSIFLRGHLDYSERSISRLTYSAMIGYKYKDDFIGGLEFDYQENYNFRNDYDIFGYSVYGTWNMNSKWQILGRFDFLRSNILLNETQPWNLASDGSSIIAGFQYKFYEGIVASLNYQDWVAYAANLTNEKYVFLNVEVKF